MNVYTSRRVFLCRPTYAFLTYTNKSASRTHANPNTPTFNVRVRRRLSTRSTSVWPAAEPQWNENNFSQHSPQKKFCWHGVTELKRLLDAIAARGSSLLSPLLEVVVTLEVLNWEHKSYQGIRTQAAASKQKQPAHGRMLPRALRHRYRRHIRVWLERTYWLVGSLWLGLTHSD